MDYINDYIEYNKNKNTKLSKKILEYMDKDIISSIIVDGKVYWYEKYINIPVPKYIYNDIKKYMNKRGYRYLYELN